jgi:hypothetical protein
VSPIPPQASRDLFVYTRNNNNLQYIASQRFFIIAEVNSEVVADPGCLVRKPSTVLAVGLTTHISSPDTSSVDYIKGGACDVVGDGIETRRV